MKVKPSKIVKFAGIPIYEHKYGQYENIQRIFGITVRRVVEDEKGIKSYFCGIRYRLVKKPLVYRRTPLIIDEKKICEIKKNNQKEVLLTLGPGLGDYIITRNFIEEIKKSEKYKGYRIAVICDESYRAFAEWLDAGIIDTFIPYGEKISYHSKDLLAWERIRCNLIKNGLKCYYDTIIYVSYVFNGAHQRMTANHLTYSVVSRQRIGFCLSSWQEKAEAFMHMTHMHFVGCKNDRIPIFELLRELFEDILEKELTFPHPYINIDRIPPAQVSEKYIVIHPCASMQSKNNMWHRNNWIELIPRIKHVLDHRIVFICAKSEEEYVRSIQEELSYVNMEVEVRAGLDIPDLLSTILYSDLFIGMDSSMFHISAALGAKTLCISSGRSYCRFLSGYLKGRDNVRIIFPKGWEAWFNDMIKDPFWNYPHNSYVINAISVSDVEKAICEMV